VRRLHGNHPAIRRLIARLALVGCLALGLGLLGPPRASLAGLLPDSPAGTLPQLDDAGRVRAAAEPASLGLREQRVRGWSVWTQDGVPAAQVDWTVGAAEIATRRLPTDVGLAPPTRPVVLYLFADGDAFRRLTSELTSLPVSAIFAFEGGRSYAAGARRGIYVNAGSLASAGQAARLVAHEMVHLAERDAAGGRPVPRWFSEGLAEHFAQQVMARVDAPATAERQWRRAAAVASALHRSATLPLSALTTPAQWSDAAAAGFDRLIYAEALLAVDWLATRGAPGAMGRVIDDVGHEQSFSAALEAATGVRASALDATMDRALRADLLPRFPVGIHIYQESGPPGTRFQFAAVGLSPREVLTRQFEREDGYAARNSGAPAVVGLAGAAYWTFQTRPDSLPATWWLTVQGDQGTQARLPFSIEPAADPPPAS